MDFHGPDFILAIIAMSMAGWIVTSWIRARHGYPIENEWGAIIAIYEELTKDEPPVMVWSIEWISA